MKGKLHPNKILVLDEKQTEQKTASGIIVPTAVRFPHQKGTIILAGKGVGEIGMPYTEGDMVLYNPNAGLKVTIDDVDYRLVDLQEIYLAL
jgi:chaperonin GroES